MSLDVIVSGKMVAAGRALLGWSGADLARRAGVTANTIVAVERDRSVRPSTWAAVREALQAAGIEFIPDGVRLVKRPKRRR
jgi:transcriptional regulator with XRE-family HTH domain